MKPVHPQNQIPSLPQRESDILASDISASQTAENATANALAGNKRRVHIKSYGCQMNVYDAGRMADLLAPEGYSETGDMAEADLVIFNTCNIREKAAEKLYSELGRVRDIQTGRRQAGLDTKVIVAGCVAQAEGGELLKRSKTVDLVVGPQSYHRLPQLLEKSRLRQRAVDTEFPLDDKFNHLPAPAPERVRARGYSAFVTVQEGCDKFCTFCVVPYTRGAEMSRPVSRILEEAHQLVEAGVREITLLGQNVNAYHGIGPAGEDCNLSDLLRALAKIDGLERLRFTTSHPNEMSDRLIELYRDLPQLMPGLHLPVQSGSDRILKAMNRRHTADQYRAIIDRVRNTCPDIAISSDFIVGFPGETDADFEATMQLVRDVNYASAYSFKYSPRPGTPAADRKQQVPDPVASQRLQALQNLIRDQQTAFNTATIGKTLDVLVEKPGREIGQIGGKSPYQQAVHFMGPPSLIGTIVPVTIRSLMSNSLTGEWVAGIPAFVKSNHKADTENGRAA